MKQYLKNLIIALLGRNPYRDELDGLKEKLEKAGENVESWRDMYYKLWDNTAALDVKLKEAGKQIASLQALVENLRERIREKDAMIAQQMENDKTTSRT